MKCQELGELCVTRSGFTYNDVNNRTDYHDERYDDIDQNNCYLCYLENNEEDYYNNDTRYYENEYYESEEYESGDYESEYYESEYYESEDCESEEYENILYEIETYESYEN